eukprot:COSAG02_NODE_530_length_20697_cov_20.103457_18_plen_186_part_00
MTFKLMMCVFSAALCGLAVADYEDPRKGSCAAGEMPAKFPFGGCMCMPKCTAGKCPAAPGGATAIPTCEFSSTGKPPPDYCGLRCKNGETCPTGTSCEMPTGICAYPYPMGEPETDDDNLVEFQLLEPGLETTPVLPPTPPRDPNDPYYTAYHFQPLKNWMNDPNGKPLFRRSILHPPGCWSSTA